MCKSLRWAFEINCLTEYSWLSHEERTIALILQIRKWMLWKSNWRKVTMPLRPHPLRYLGVNIGTSFGWLWLCLEVKERAISRLNGNKRTHYHLQLCAQLSTSFAISLPHFLPTYSTGTSTLLREKDALPCDFPTKIPHDLAHDYFLEHISWKFFPSHTLLLSP